LSRFQITLSEYNRIYQVAHGVIRDIGKAEKACIFFACIGAMILNKHFKIPARAVAGAFALCVSDKPEVAFFGEDTGGRVIASPDGFHMWVQTSTHIIDFMAPIFPEAFADRNLTIPRKMFQRQMTSEAERPDALTAPGDFFTLPEPDLTETLIENFLGRASNTDLLMVADTWFRGRRLEQNRTMVMQNDLGEVYRLTLPRTTALGAW
jgi:hypothetical protein